MRKTSDTEEARSKWKLIGSVALTVVLALWSINWYIGVYRLEYLQNAGTVGDAFGAVNALFSGLAFAGVIVTLVMQREELELQRRQLERTADAQKASEAALREQVEQMSRTAKMNAVLTVLEVLRLGGETAQRSEWQRKKRLAFDVLVKADPSLGDFVDQLDVAH